MAAETVSAFTPVVYSDSMNGYGVDILDRRPSSNEGDENDSDSNMKNLQATYKKRSEMNDNELSSARERDRVQSRKRREKAELKRLEKLKEHEIRGSELNMTAVVNNINALSKEEKNSDSCDSKASTEVKKRRNIRKRNRSDMSPEELRRLRERERKAQQSRRDRIRAQKKQAQGWHDDDAAWEAFLDQTENTNDSPSRKASSKKQCNSSVPSMVCNISPHSSGSPDRVSDNGSSPKKVQSSNPEELANESTYPPTIDERREIVSQVSVQSNDTESLNSAGQSAVYSSDENSQDMKENGIKRLSRRHYLPSQELERLRKRERDAKRKQREKHRQTASFDLPADQRDSSEVFKEERESRQCESTESNAKIEQIDSLESMPVTSSPKQKSIPLSLKNISPRSHITSPRSHLTSPQSHLTSPSVFHSPHSHGPHHYYPPMVYMPDRHSSTHHQHHYSPHSHYMSEGRHYSDVHYPHHLTEDRHYLPESHRLETHHHSMHELHSRHHPHISTVVHQPHISSTASSTSPELKSKTSAVNSSLSLGNNEKKRMISRNVDRKKLSEDELEELRRRERDYQRERRARIRLEKAKSQASHDQYQQNTREDSMSHYYHPSSVYHSMHRHHDDIRMHQHGKSVHQMIPRYEPEDRFDYHHHSAESSNLDHRHSTEPSQLEKELEERAVYMFEHNKELAVSIPSDSRFDRVNARLSNGKETELLQVVPKTRDCEDMKPPTKYSPGDVSTSSSNTSQTKKSVLENICLSLKKESTEWLDDTVDEDDDKLVIVQPNNEVTRWDNPTLSVDNGESLTNLKGELTNGFSTMCKGQTARPEMSIEDRLQCIKEGINEDQLERRRRSNREAQRRRRARLKMQGSSEDQLDSSLDYSTESSEFDSQKEKTKTLNGAYEEEKLLAHYRGKGCRVKVTPSRPDSLYPDDVHPRHAYPIDKHDHHFLHDKFGHYARDSYLHSEKHFYIPSHHRSIQDVDDIHHGHFYHDPPYADRHAHEHSSHYKRHGYPTYNIKDRTHYSHIPSKREDADETETSVVTHRVESSPKSHESNNETEVEHSKQTGRKRKQFVPRKIVSSTTTTPEEDVDILNVSKSPEEEQSIFNIAETESPCKKLKQDVQSDSLEKTTDFVHTEESLYLDTNKNTVSNSV